MVRTANRDAGFYIRNKIPFNGSNFYGRKDNDGSYRVDSYQTTMCVIYPDNYYWLNPRKYSPTTSRHTSIIRRALASMNVHEDTED